MNESAPAIILKDVTVAYERHPAVHHASGVFREGSLTAIVGPNGAGKSSLLKAITGLIRPSEGSIECPGRAFRDIGYLPQLSVIEDNFPITVFDIALLGYWRYSGACGSISRAMRDKAVDALGQVGLADILKRNFFSLSAGQKQRVLFARLMLADTPIILLDEPFSSIDSQTTDGLMKLIHQWHQEGRTILTVLHDLSLAREHFPEALLIARNIIAWGNSATCLQSSNLRRASSMSMAWGPDDDDICDGSP